MQRLWWFIIDRNDMWLSSGCHYNKFISLTDEPCRQEDNHGIPVLCAVHKLNANVNIRTLWYVNWHFISLSLTLDIVMFESSYIKMSCSVSWNDFEENISELCQECYSLCLLKTSLFLSSNFHQKTFFLLLFFFCSIYISVQYGLPTICIQVAQEVLAHLLVINIASVTSV